MTGAAKAVTETRECDVYELLRQKKFRPAKRRFSATVFNRNTRRRRCFLRADVHFCADSFFNADLGRVYAPFCGDKHCMRFVFRRVSDGTSDKEQRTPKRNNMRGVLCAYPHSRLHNLQRARRRRSACIRAVCRGDLHGVSRRNFRGQLGKIVF